MFSRRYASMFALPREFGTIHGSTTSKRAINELSRLRVPGCMPGISIHCRRHRTRTVTWVVAQPRRLRHHGWSMVYDTIFQTDTQTILPSGAYFQQ